MYSQFMMHGQKNIKLKSFCCYNSHEVSLCGGCLYSLFVDATVVLAQYVLSLSVCPAV